ncbi:MAG: PDDEXK nuclease domain-containing protein [Candidatus Omnitrophica bacterium]|nr:PDDEXK nuclease domain-containing protein [Candidatus Omnitrophota bacterium]
MKKKIKIIPEANCSSGRKSRGRQRDSASFPAPISSTEMPQNYAVVLGKIKERIRTERLRVVMAANAAMVLLYWDIGKEILERQEREGWGTKVIDRLSADLREAFPDMKGLSPRNLKYMRAFSTAWPDREFVQGPLAQIPWYHHIALLEKCRSREERLWYADQSAMHGWSHNILSIQIETQTYKRHGRVINNFSRILPPEHSDMAVQVFKDPYLFDFLGTADPRCEREVEQALVDHVQKFLLELGTGFAFVGRQVHLEFADADYYIDLLFYHLKLRRYIVVELKAVPFDPGFAGTLNMYLSAVDDLMRHPDDKPAIGLLLCRSKNKMVVEYALRDFKKPMDVADWETALVHSFPPEFKGSLPTVDELEAELMKEENKISENFKRLKI